MKKKAPETGPFFYAVIARSVSDEAIQSLTWGLWIASLAPRNDGFRS